MFRIVTVPLDLTADADRAIGPAVALAQQLGAPLELVVVSSPGLDLGADEYELHARAAQLAGVTTTTRVLTGDRALDALAPLAADPDRLFCMASHGRGRLGEMLTPNLSLDLVRAAQRPIVVIGPRQEWWPGPARLLYLGVDERGVPEPTLRFVDACSCALDAEVGIVQTQRPDGRDEQPAEGSFGVEAARAWMEERGHRVTVRHLVGEPAVTLADTADRASRQCPVVVVTARTSTRRERVLHGSVTGRLIAVSPVPTLVVPVAIAADAATLSAAVLAVDR